jgi:hypothetical protein
LKPEFLVDRALGRYDVPHALRNKGFIVRTLFDVYGAKEQRLGDEVWAREAGEKAWAVLTCDARIRRGAGERLMRRYGVGVFALPNGNMSGPAQAGRYVDYLPDMVRVWLEEQRPYIYRVYRHGLEKRWPR